LNQRENVFYPCFLSDSEVGNLQCARTLPAVQNCIDEHGIPASAKTFQIYNGTKELLRPNKKSQAYHGAMITNQLANAVPGERVIASIEKSRDENLEKIQTLSNRSNGMDINLYSHW
jgi:hypothetical protein